MSDAMYMDDPSAHPEPPVCSCEPFDDVIDAGYVEHMLEPDPDCPVHFPKDRMLPHELEAREMLRSRVQDGTLPFEVGQMIAVLDRVFPARPPESEPIVLDGTKTPPGWRDPAGQAAMEITAKYDKESDAATGGE